MKKFIVLSALVAVVSTAFVACSSDDDLAQQPKAPETIVDTPKGTPFSLSVSADTRATLYGTTGWTAANSTSSNWIKDIKIYGILNGATTPWMDSNVFSRASYNTDTWTTTRDAQSTSAATPTWPKGTSEATSFYAITDNAIGVGTTAAISNVGAWMTTPGTFTYTMATTNGAVPRIDPAMGTGVLVEPVENADYVDDSELKDLMVASATKKESETDGGKLSLTFSHVLAGLNIKVIFRNDGVTSPTGSNVDYAEIHYIKIVGLKTSGTYTFNPTGTNPNWNTSAGASICYYKPFATPIEVKAFLEATTADDADQNKWLVEKTDPWMVIPQTTVPWTCQAPGPGNNIEDLVGGGNMAYVVLGITDHAHVPDVEVFLPLATTFVAGTNKTLRLDLGKFRDLYQNDSGEAPYYFAPAAGGGSGSGARGYDFIDE